MDNCSHCQNLKARCRHKDETIKILEQAIASLEQSSQYWLDSAKWWMEYRTGLPYHLIEEFRDHYPAGSAKLPKRDRPNHLKLASG